jgi:hypothetical protein
VIIVIVLALLLIPISKNFLIYSLTFSQNVSPDSKLFIGMEFFFYLLCVLSPFLFYGIFKRKKIIEFNSIIWNFIFILITSIFFLFNVNKLVNLFQFKTREYVYYELVYLDSEKLAKWGLKDLYLFDNNEIVKIFYFLSILILFVECLYLFVIIPLKPLQIKYKLYEGRFVTLYGIINIVFIVIFLFFSFILFDIKSNKNLGKSNKTDLYPSVQFLNRELTESKRKDNSGINYSGTLDNGSRVSFTIKMIGENSYLISNGNQCRMSLLSNGRYLIEDGPMVGMSLYPTSSACTIYAVDGTYIDNLPASE